MVSNDESLRHWREFRSTLSELPIHARLEAVALFFRNTPFGSRTLDYYSSENWPTPWEILYYGSFCKSSISLLIAYTLFMVDNECDIRLYLIDDRSDIYLIPAVRVENTWYMLNYYLGEIIDINQIQNEFSIIKEYNQIDLKKVR